MVNFSPKGKKLIEMYSEMVSKGYYRGDMHLESKDVFSDFQSRFFRDQIKNVFKDHKIKSVLDYGCGGSNWDEKNFHQDGQSAKEFYNLDRCFRYEPARNLDERQKVDCVLNFDVLEHIFIADVPNVIRDIFSYAKKLVIINVACYPAAAKLPNGENAHITVRHPHWWKAQIDMVALDFPKISILLLTSPAYNKPVAFPIYKAQDWADSKNFVIPDLL